MNKISRREAVTGIFTAGLTIVTMSATTSAQNETPFRAFQGQHQPKPLPFDPAKLTGLSEKLVKSHWENNYSGAVKALNVVEQRLAAMLKQKDLPAYLYGDLKREELIRTGSIVLQKNILLTLAETEKLTGRPSN
jgi:superoxide dismutase, Fe-Mn family